MKVFVHHINPTGQRTAVEVETRTRIVNFYTES